MCVLDCTNVDGAVGGRFSPADVNKYIKVPPYKRTDKSYHPNITDTIDKATNLETQLIEKAAEDNVPVYKYQLEQGTEIVFTDESTEDIIVFQPHLTMTAISWLPNEEFY